VKKCSDGIDLADAPDHCRGNMNLHVARVRRGSTVYVYGQLVESQRRADGMPTQKVIANLGRLSDVEIENLRIALDASRRGARVFLDKRQLPKATQFAKPTHNLRYLDLAVLRALWCEWKLDEIIDDLLPKKASEIAPSDVVAALTFQRCVDPGSKLYAERWFPTTCLPELLRVDADRFNNTRLHRVLEQLEKATPTLMQRLSRQYGAQVGRSAAFFLDVTDARFVGDGPALAEKAKTKEGVIERKIGIVLLCNDRGYPVRWSVIAGKCPDARAMHDVFDEIRGLDWVGEAPVVCDRSMGCSAEIAKLLGTGVRFVTALRSNEWGAYTNAIPYACIADLEPVADASSDGPCAVEAARRVTKAGMERVSPTLYVLDLGVIDRDGTERLLAPTSPSTSIDASRAVKPAQQIEADQAASRAMKLAQQIDADQAASGSLNSAARRRGITIGAAKGYRRLLKLGAELQQDVLDGRGCNVSLARLYAIAALPDEDQRRAFDQARSRAASGSKRASVARELRVDEPMPPLRVRAVVAFNPELFVDHRRTAQKQLDDVRLFVLELNESLARPRARRTPREIEAEIDRVLRRRNLVDAFTIRIDEIETANGPRHQVRAQLDPLKWERRRRHDGFNVIVAHPEVPHKPGDLCQLYRAKDAVEKDFQVIKGLVGLRPIWHHTDAKVRAHVTLCMLALLLERTLNERLKHVSAERAIQTFSTCCLNRFQDTKGESHYVVTQPDASQQALLRELKLGSLADDNYVIERLQPR
jgi:hypothetical protein